VTMVVPAVTIAVTIDVVVSCCPDRGMTQVTRVTIDLHPFRGAVSLLHRSTHLRRFSVPCLRGVKELLEIAACTDDGRISEVVVNACWPLTIKRSRHGAIENSVPWAAPWRDS
jgi:hypothetical protein